MSAHQLTGELHQRSIFDEAPKAQMIGAALGQSGQFADAPELEIQFGQFESVIGLRESLEPGIRWEQSGWVGRRGG
jgi:hypothetical protein